MTIRRVIGELELELTKQVKMRARVLEARAKKTEKCALSSGLLRRGSKRQADPNADVGVFGIDKLVDDIEQLYNSLKRHWSEQRFRQKPPQQQICHNLSSFSQSHFSQGRQLASPDLVADRLLLRAFLHPNNSGFCFKMAVKPFTANSELERSGLIWLWGFALTFLLLLILGLQTQPHPILLVTL
jgi:hypothetical protein